MESQDLGKASQPAYRAGSPPYKQALIVLYCPPGLSTSLFFDDFSHYLNYVSTTPGYLLLVGDFNLHVDTSDHVAKRFVNLLQSFNLVQHVNSETHSNGHT